MDILQGKLLQPFWTDPSADKCLPDVFVPSKSGANWPICGEDVKGVKYFSGRPGRDPGCRASDLFFVVDQDALRRTVGVFILAAA